MGKNFKLLMTFLLCLLGMAAKAQTVEISTVDQLKAFRDAVNNGTTYAGQTVKLTADLDLSSEANWVPIGNLVAYPGQSFNGTFDGNGNKISNITCNANTPNHAVAGLFGSVVNGTIKDLTVENVNISSTHYAAGIVAYTSNGPTIENCKVIGGTISSTPELLNGSYDNGDKVGGIMGYATAGSTINNCWVENVTITAYRDLGGIVGYSAGTVTNNTAKNVTVTQDLTNGYKDPTPTTVGDIIGRNEGATLSNNVVIKPNYVAQVGNVKFETLQTAFDAAQAGETVTLLTNVDATGAMYSGDNRFNLWIKNGITVDGAGYTITVKGRGIGIQGTSSNIDVTFKDATVKNVGNENGRCIDTRGKLASLTLDNTTLTTAESTYTGYLQPLTIGGNQATAATVKITNNSQIIVVDDANKGYAITTFNPVNMTIDGSTIKGWACLNIKAADSSAGSNSSVFNITNSEMTSKNVYSGETNAFSVIKIEDVDVTVNITNTEINVIGEQNRQAIVGFETNNTKESVVNMGEGNNVTFTGTTDFAHNDNSASKLIISGGIFNQPVPEENCAEGMIPTKLGEGQYSVKVGSFVAKVGNVKYGTLQEAIDAASEGNTVTLLTDINMGATAVNINKGITLDGAGYTITSTANAAVEVSGTGNVTISNTKINATNGRGVQVGNVAHYSGVLTINESTEITVAKRGINILDVDEGFELNIDNAVVQTNVDDPTTAYTTGEDSRGINFSNDPLTFTANITNSEIQGFSYGINVYSGTEKLTVNMTGGKFYGRDVVNNWGKNNTFNLDGVEVHGLNNQIGPTEAFACIVENQGSANNNYNINNSQFIATLSDAAINAANSNASEYMIDLRGNNTKVVITGNTTYTTNAPERGGFIEYEPYIDNNTIMMDETAATTFSNAFEDYKVVETEEAPGYIVAKKVYVAQIGDVKYETFEDAWNAVQDGETITLLKDCAGNGIVAPDSKFTTGVTVDFGGFTYIMDGELVGSSGTQTQAFQLLKGNNITFKNGSITSDKAKMLINNYSNLTLEGMTLTMNNTSYASGYTLSNNNGNIVIDGSTINANTGGGVAFDVCRGGGGATTYLSVNVTVKGESVINGDIEVDAKNGDPADGLSLTIEEDATITGNLKLTSGGAKAITDTPEKAVVTKSNDVTLAAPADFKWVANEDGITSTLAPCEYVAQYNGTKYESLQAAIDAAEADDPEDIVIDMLADCSLDITAWSGTQNSLAIGTANTQSITINGNNHTLNFNQKNSDWNNIATMNDAVTKLVLNNIALTNSGHNDGPWNRHDINFNCAVELNNVTSDKVMAFKNAATLKNVTIEDTGDIYGIWIQPNGQNVSIDGLTLTAGRGIKIDDQYVDNPQNTTLNIANATFNTTKKSAILVKSAALTTVNAGEGINIENVAADKVNPVWVDEDRAEEFYKVTVTGATVVPETKESDYVAKLIDTDNTILGYYKALNKAINTATTGQTVAILQANTYTLPGLPLNITVEGAVEGVQFTHTTAGNVAAIPNGATFKNVAFNFDNVNYHGFQHAGTINMEGCTLNGRLTSYGDMNFTNCAFNHSGDYHMWAYSGNLTYTGCTFTNSSKGKFINVYNESGATKYTVTTTNCNFINQGSSSKAVLNVKATCIDNGNVLAYDVIINNCTTEGAFPEANWGDALVVLNNLAQVDDRTADGVDNIKVWQDDVLIYPVYVAQIGETQYPTLQSALNAAHEMTGDVTVELLKDIKGYSIVHQKAGLNLTIDGKDFTLNGQIIIDGDGRADVAGELETLTIKNFKFEGKGTDFYSGTDAFILVPSTKDTDKPWTTGAYNYAHNVTVSGCSFTSTSDAFDVVGFKSTSGAGDYNVVITECTGTNLHSLAQLTGTTGGSFTNNNVTGGESFVNISGGTGNFTVSGNTFTSADGADGYGIRENASSTATITLTDNTFTAAKAVVLGKKSSTTNGTINVVSGIYVGDIVKDIAASATGKIVISGGHFSASIADAAYADFIAEGLCGVNGIYLNETPEAPNGIGDAVASVTFADNTTLRYASLEAAIAAVPTDGTEATVTLLVDVTENAVVTDGKNFVLDLNEKTLTGYIDQYDSQITVQNGTVAGTVYVNGGATSTDNYNKFTLAENAIINADYGIVLYQANGTTAGYGSTININGTVNGMVWVMGNIEDGNSVINVNSGAEITGDVGIALNGNATVNVADGTTITGSEVGIEARAGVLNVEGGTITSTAAAYSFTPNGSGTTTFGAAIAVAQHNTGLDVEVNINGGTLNGVKSIAVADAQSNDLENVTVKVKDELVTDNTLIPEGFAWASNGDGTSSPKKAVAKIGDILYASLADAVAAVPTDGTETTITMIDNEMIDVVGSAVTIPSNKNVVIDLNGFQVVGTAAGGSTSALITNKGTLTIKDSSDTNADGTGTGQLISGATTTWIYEGDGNYAGSYASNTITNSGTLTIESGYIENLSTGSATYAVDNNSSGGNAILNMNGGLLKAKSVAVREFANSTTFDNVINMAGGTITAGYSGIWIQLPGSDATKAMKAGLNVSGGTIAGGSYAFYDYSYGNLFDATQYNLNGGTFNGDIFSYGANITITDGTYNGEVAIKQAKPSNVAVSGGKFASDVYTYGANASEGFITGGVYAINTYEYEGTTYDCDWLSLLADGYYPCANTDPETMENYPYTVKNSGVFDLYDLASKRDDKYPYLGTSVMSDVKVTYHRTISSGNVDKFQAWFVPMDYTIKAEDLENFKFWKIHMVAGSRDPQGGAVDENNEDNLQIWIHIFSMDEGDVLKGNRPYVITPKVAGDFDFTEESTKIYPAEPEPTCHLKLATSYYIYNFYGTYEPYITSKARELIGLGGGKIRPNGSGDNLGIYRWYIKPTSNNYNDDYSNLRIGFVVDGEEDPTSIFAIEDADGSDEISGIYSVNGTKYGTTMDDLQKGVNIIRYKNGTSKKVLVK